MNYRLSAATAWLLILLSWSAHSAEFETVVPMYDKGAATYYVAGALTGYGPVEMMVDTGSGFTTLNEEALARLQESGMVEFLRELTGVMADGSRRTVPVYRVGELVVGDGCVVRDVEAAVFPGRTRLLLGLNALKKTAPFALSVDPPQLRLSNCGA